MAVMESGATQVRNRKTHNYAHLVARDKTNALSLTCGAGVFQQRQTGLACGGYLSSVNLQAVATCALKDTVSHKGGN